MTLERYKRIVREHGDDVEDSVDDGDMDSLNWWPDGMKAVRAAKSYSLTNSEEDALEWIKSVFEPRHKLRRSNSGVDFVLGNVGFEIKSTEWYDLSSVQLAHCEDLDYVLIIYSNDGLTRVMDVMDRRSIEAEKRNRGEQ
jgi:hypothetical protein